MTIHTEAPHMLSPKHDALDEFAARIASRIISSIVGPKDELQENLDAVDLEIDKQNKVLYCAFRVRENNKFGRPAFK